MSATAARVPNRLPKLTWQLIVKTDPAIRYNALYHLVSGTPRRDDRPLPLMLCGSEGVTGIDTMTTTGAKPAGHYACDLCWVKWARDRAQSSVPPMDPAAHLRLYQRTEGISDNRVYELMEAGRLVLVMAWGSRKEAAARGTVWHRVPTRPMTATACGKPVKDPFWVSGAPPLVVMLVRPGEPGMAHCEACARALARPRSRA